MQNQQYGKLLFEMPEHEIEYEKKVKFRSSILWLGAGIFIIILSIYIIFNDLIGFMFLSIGMVFLIMALIHFKWYHEIDTYRIYEKGIYMAYKNSPLLEFNDIEHIKIGYDPKYRSNFFLIKKRGEKLYNCRFGDGPTRYITIVMPKYYKKMLRIIIKQLIESHPGVNESELILKQEDKLIRTKEAK